MIHSRGLPLLAIGFLGFLSLTSSKPYSISQVGDVTIKDTGETFQCDRIVCPTGTYRCEVTKSNDPNDPQVIIRRNICSNRSGQILADHTSEERVAPGVQKDVHVTMVKDGGTVITSQSSDGTDSFNWDEEKEKKLREKLDQMEKKLRETFGSSWSPF